MNNGVYFLLIAQFLSAFADNALLFAVIAMVMQGGHPDNWYVPALQSAFLVAFVVLAPWVGQFADRRPKPWVLIIGNAIKAIGTFMILAGIEPLLAYAVVGMGAAVYGPAKYGILPELVGHETLVKANGLIEGSTILAIVLGTVIGGRLADTSVNAALMLVLLTYVCSVAATLFLPKLTARGGEAGPALVQFVIKMRGFFTSARARFSMLGASLFWAAAAVLRVLLVAWAPIVLLMKNASEIGELTLFLAIGIVTGAVLVPRLIPIERLRRARLAAYCMSALIVFLASIEIIWPARLVLFAIGISGGMFVVPVNAALQEIGHRTIGSGGAIAIQNFFENVAMLLAVGLYTFAASKGAHPVPTLMALGGSALIATLIVSWHLPRDPEPVAVILADHPRATDEKLFEKSE